MSLDCNKTQNSVTQALKGSNVPNVVAAFGNTTVSDTQSWIKILGPSNCEVIESFFFFGGGAVSITQL